MLRSSAELVSRLRREDLADIMTQALTGEPLAKPLDHKGPPETDMFRLNMNRAHRREVLELVKQAYANQTLSLGERGLGGFVEAWQEFAECD